MAYLPYWLLFLLPAVMALAGREHGRRVPSGMARLTVGWIVFGLTLLAMIGLRDRVGGDWFNYLRHLEVAAGMEISEVVSGSDPGYRLLNWLAAELGGGIYTVNMIAASIFTWGLVAFCRSLPRPWLAATVAVPYLVIVVAMGYSRQGIALGFAMLGLLALQKGRITRFAIWVLIGATFHRSAVLLLPIAALTTTRNRFFAVIWIGVLSLVGYQALVERDMEDLYTNYIEREYRSEGALIRLLLNGVAGCVFLVLRKRFQQVPAARLLWLWMSLLALLLLGVYFVSPGSSAALDRMGLYLLPLQLMVFSHLPHVLRGGAALWTVAVVAYYAMVQMVWLNFAANAYAWLPYRFYLLEDGF